MYLVYKDSTWSNKPCVRWLGTYLKKSIITKIMNYFLKGIGFVTNKQTIRNLFKISKLFYFSIPQ